MSFIFFVLLATSIVVQFSFVELSKKQSHFPMIPSKQFSDWTTPTKNEIKVPVTNNDNDENERGEENLKRIRAAYAKSFIELVIYFFLIFEFNYYI